MASALFRPRQWLVVILISLLALAAAARADDAITSTDDRPVRLLLGEAALQSLDASTPADAPPAEVLAEGAPAEQDPYGILLRRIEELEAAEAKRQEAEDKKKADEKKKKADDELKLKDWIDVSNEKWTVKLGGHVQLDYINWADHTPTIPASDYFEFRRLRLVADGTGYGVYDFRLQMTLEPETLGTAPNTFTAPQVKDAYFSINEVPWLGRVRIGNFFVPYGLEQVTNDTNTVFLERSIPTQGVFTPDREVGIAIYNCTDDQSLSWASGVFLDSISEGAKQRIDNNQGYRASGRINWVPYYDEPSNGRYLIHTGAGVLYTKDQDDIARFAARPQIRLGPQIIDSGIIPADNFTSANVEFAAVMGPFSMQSEAFICSVDTLTGGPLTYNGWYIHANYFLTGENRLYDRFGQHGAQFARFVPRNNVFGTPRGCSLGAWEIKARHSYLSLNDSNDGDYSDITIGMNWYWSDRVRILFDYIHPITSSAAIFGATTSDILASRFDFNW